MKDTNLLGSNIQRLREIHGDTLENLGDAIGFAKSTIKGYENGSRKPDPDTLKTIANYYGKTVDELMHTDMTSLDKIDVQQISLSSTVETFKKIMPLFSSEEAMNNASFKKGYNLSQRILSAFASGETLRGTIIKEVTALFAQSTNETEAPEAIANLVWSIFVWWSQIFDAKEMLALQNKLLSKRIDMIELSREIKNLSPEVESRRQGFISDIDELLCESIKSLKSNKNWSDLGDYYLALRYTNGLVDTALSAEMNVTMGIQLMIAYAQLDNKYAKMFLRSCR
ncbi:MAG TPA: helix-turn-helix transcriptional regulator [Epulopiscium sp.]|nr:helix-turn-helix transcriptional regulator [Candidatus Epulonipiscium sp.]